MGRELCIHVPLPKCFGQQVELNQQRQDRIRKVAEAQGPGSKLPKTGNLGGFGRGVLGPQGAGHAQGLTRGCFCLRVLGCRIRRFWSLGL